MPDRPAISDESTTGSLSERRRELAAQWRAERSRSPSGIAKLIAESALRGGITAAGYAWKWWVDAWFRLGWGMRVTMLVATVGGGLLMLGFTLNGAQRIVGAGPATRVETRPVSWRAPGPLAKALSTAVEEATGDQITVRGEGLAVTWYPEGVLVVNPDDGDRQLTDRDGTTWRDRGECWARIGDGAAPELSDVLLPLDPSSTRWRGTPARASFTASRLGSWGEGRGTASFRDGRMVGYSYTPDDGDRFRFSIVQSESVEAPEIDECGD